MIKAELPWLQRNDLTRLDYDARYAVAVSADVFCSQLMMMIFVINVFRRQGCPYLGQGHGPIVSSRHRI